MFGFPKRLVILMYHRVHAQPDSLRPWDVSGAEFDWQLSVLKRHFKVLPLLEAFRRMRAGTLPPRAACITFDDGYADNHDVALPLLKRHGLTATFFIATGYLDGGRMWNDTLIDAVACASGDELDARQIGLGRFPIRTEQERLDTVHQLLGALKYAEPGERIERSQSLWDQVGVEKFSMHHMMTTNQLLALHSSGMEIGAHTVSHPILARVPHDRAQAEICESRERLQEILDSDIHIFAYPNGRPGRDYNRQHVEMVHDAGFECAVSTAWGYADAKMDSYQLARIAPWDKSPLRFGMRVFRGYFGSCPELA